MAFTLAINKTFDAIAAAGDVSPALVAGGISNGYSHLPLGLLCLATAYLFKYINQ